MTNKETINKLRDNAELAWAAYGFFHLANPNYDFDKDSTDKERLEYFRILKKQELKQLNPSITDQELQNTYPTPSDILNIEYKYFKDEITGKLKDGFFDDELFSGEFAPLQAKRLFERYDLLIHQPNTETSFSATLFGEKRKQTHTKTKKASYTSKYGYVNYILAIRGTNIKSNQLQDTIVTNSAYFLVFGEKQCYL